MEIKNQLIHLMPLVLASSLIHIQLVRLLSIIVIIFFIGLGIGLLF